MIKNGKLFGKINLFDAGILLLIIALIIAGISKFKTFNKSIESENLGTIDYTFKIENVREYTANAFMSGDYVYDSGTNNLIGIIKGIEIKDAEMEERLANGIVKVLENPYKKDITLLIETLGTSTGSGYYANKIIELKVGSEKNIKTRYASCAGTIGMIKYSEGE